MCQPEDGQTAMAPVRHHLAEALRLAIDLDETLAAALIGDAHDLVVRRIEQANHRA